MKHVRFTSPGNGSFEEAARRNDDGSGVGIISADEAERYGYEEVDEKTYLVEKAAVLAHNAALPSPDPPPVLPSFSEREVAAVRDLIRVHSEAKPSLSEEEIAEVRALIRQGR